MTNATLRQDVIDELEFEPSIDAANIGIAAKNGVVTLTGHVGTYAEKLAALEAARRVKGVLAVANEIEVRYADEKKTSDEEIAKRVIDILAWDTMVPARTVQATVQKGWVTLNGEVQWHYQRRAAEDAVRKLGGVRGVINNIMLRPRAAPSEVRRRIEEALKRNAEIEAAAIRVDVEGGKVSLHGKVATWDERVAVEKAAWSIPGVANVEDHLTITGSY